MFTEDNKPTDQVENKDLPAGGAAEQVQAPSDYTDLLGTIVNERGEPKYTDVPNALKALSHAQEHIHRLEVENAQFKEQVAKVGNIEEALAKLTAQKEPTDAQPVGLDEQAVSGLLERLLQEKTAKEQVQKNQSTVEKALIERFGDKAADEFKAKAQSLGMTKEQLESLAATSPVAVLSFFGTTVPSSPSTSSINSAAFQPKVNEIPTIMDGGEERINLPAGQKSVLAWASNNDVKAEMERHKAAVYAKYGITP